jgi:cysteine desulfurase/selenocysteine lyase
VRRFINAASTCEIVFTRNATEGINLVAQTFGGTRLGPGDEVVISAMEHHSNIVPWQMVCQEKGASLRVIPITDEGALQLEKYSGFSGHAAGLDRPSVDVLGTINPVQQMIATAHRRGVPVLVDGSQAAHHMSGGRQASTPTSAFTGHKLCGPTGIGVLARSVCSRRCRRIRAAATHDQLGHVREDHAAPCRHHKFEAGTPNIAGAVGLAAAVDYVRIGMDAVTAHGTSCLRTERRRCRGAGLTLDRNGARKGERALVRDGRCAPARHRHRRRSGGVGDPHGHHCAQPLMQRLGIPPPRASLALYNTREIDAPSSPRST